MWYCSDKRPPPCQTCRLEKEERDRKDRRDKELELERQAKQRAYAKQLAAVRDDIARQRQAVKDHREQQLREQTLRQHQAELTQVTKETQKILNGTASSQAKETAGSQPNPDSEVSNTEEYSQEQEDRHLRTSDRESAQPDEQKTENDADPIVSHTDETGPVPARQQSSAETDWQQQKDMDLASNEALDSLMQMIGLESVKKEFLNIKARVDTAVRQGVDLKCDRFGAALLGNPGTGRGCPTPGIDLQLLTSSQAKPQSHGSMASFFPPWGSSRAATSRKQPARASRTMAYRAPRRC